MGVSLMAQTLVKTYIRKKNGKIYKVKGYLRKHRALGKRITYSPVGEFYVAHDNLGNFRGSKVVPDKKAKPVKKSSIKLPQRKPLPNRKLRKAKGELHPETEKSRKLDNDYFDGKITFDDWTEQKAKIPGRYNQ